MILDPAPPIVESIKVLHVIQGLHLGGAEQVVFTLARSINAEKIDIRVCCLARGPFWQRLKDNHIPTVCIEMKSKLDVTRPLLKLVRFIRKEGISIVHTHSVRSNLIGRLAASMTKTACVTHVHSPILRDFNDRKRCYLNEIIDRTTRPIARQFITVSDSLKQELITRGVPKKKVVTLHNGIDIDGFRTTETNGWTRTGIREEFGIGQNAQIIIVVALLRPRKGIEILIRALRSVKMKIPDVHLLVVGSDSMSEVPNYREKLERLAVELGVRSCITFTGYRKDVARILPQCDVMALPSLFGEGLPMVILEAMSEGLPVIATNVEGIPEIINPNQNGILVEPGDTEALARGLINLLMKADLRRAIIPAARATIRDSFTSAIQAQKLQKIYFDIFLSDQHS